MYITEDTQHDLLFVITAALFLLFATGLAVPPTIEDDATIIV